MRALAIAAIFQGEAVMKVLCSPLLVVLSLLAVSAPLPAPSSQHHDKHGGWSFSSISVDIPASNDDASGGDLVVVVEQPLSPDITMELVASEIPGLASQPPEAEVLLRAPKTSPPA